MTKEELKHDHIKEIAETYVNESWGSYLDLDEVDLVMAGIGVGKIIASEQKKRITELEEKISVLLSCQNCPENKGGLICAKEYENKCLAQKIEFIKELQQENAELRLKLEVLEGQTPWKDIKDKSELIKENAELKDNFKIAKDNEYEYSSLLFKAKEIIKRYLSIGVGGKITENYLDVTREAEQFIKDSKGK